MEHVRCLVFGLWLLIAIQTAQTHETETNQTSVKSKCPCDDQKECLEKQNCYDRCFSLPDNLNEHQREDRFLKQAYINIYNIVKGIRELHLPCHKPRGTFFFMDAAVPSGDYWPYLPPKDLYEMQLNLASIVALSLRVSNSSNPLSISQYMSKVACTFDHWKCRSAIEASQLFRSDYTLGRFHVDPAWKGFPSWVQGAERLAVKDIQDRRGCMNCTDDQLFISFTNSRMLWQSTECGNKYKCAAVGILPADHENMQDWTNVGPAYTLRGNWNNSFALKAINNCLYRCASETEYHVEKNMWHVKLALTARNASGVEEVDYVHLDEGKIRAVFTNPESFVKNILDGLDGGYTQGGTTTPVSSTTTTSSTSSWSTTGTTSEQP